MIDPKIEGKLTPAAREALSELIDNYRSQILLGAVRSATSYEGEVEGISVRDILSAFQRVDRSSGVWQRPRAGTAYRAVLIMGLLYVILGFGYFALQSIDVSLDRAQALGLAMGLSGSLLALVAYLRLRASASTRAYREEVVRGELFAKEGVRESDVSMLLVQAWRQIELAVRAFVASQYGESTAREPVSVLIGRVEASGALSQEDQRRLRNVLSLRNAIVHQGADVDATELRSALEDADRILAKLDRSARPT